MPNNYFKFKQFTVHQGLAAMKVGTDGVLLGAWASVEGAKSILDIGTGTGLIALMLAQRNSTARIDAIEIDEQACEQAIINFTESAWAERLHIVHTDFQSYKVDIKYDLIVSNPPYFNHALKNDCETKSKARHTDSLSFYDLIKGAGKLLNADGLFCVVLPANEKNNFKMLASQNNLYLNNVLNIKPTPTKPAKRVLMSFSLTETKLTEEELIVEEFGRHQYSERYKQLTEDFYLAF
ncbi:tRNA1(Val) (adenine(37)-N6)-methyltransferase [Saccharicrinis sp. GN24d3]|uniref:tRNA1(Val) (adenine(37)-N6)-methyltransferase n=1 Tax=Saccharicrinis sp. GN24d3 TaxID=3458416 RepID=UPI004035E492